jgi:four helix bundle protein
VKDSRVSGHQDSKATCGDNKPVAGFEKLWVWEKAHELMQGIHRFCKTLPREEKFRLKDQVERSSSSVCDNIAEGYTAYYYKDKIKGFLTARKEAGETQNHLRKLAGKDYLDKETGQVLVEKYEEVIRGINGYVRYIREKRGAKR